jgi:hypothetical protein
MTAAAVHGDNDAALNFLKKVYPDGPWVVTAIHPDRKAKAIETKTFGPASEAALLGWIDNYNGSRNIYWSTNPPVRELSKKAEREDIKEVAYFHVDIDPRAGEDLEEERKRCLALFNEKLPKGVPPPTCVVFSGGGYQGFWKLETPIPINGDLALAEDTKRYNQRLELLFGGDNCHNIDRIMRLPGTVNLPDAKKLAKGRKPTLAKLVAFEPDRVYPPSLFTPAPQEVLSPAAAGPTVFIDVSNVVRLGDISELDKYGVPDRVKVICVQGKLPDEPKGGDNSRSAWLYDAVCNLARAGVPDEVIYSIITDPEFGISESVLQSQNVHRYALKQINDARTDASLPDWLTKMNSEYACIGQVGNKFRIMWQTDGRNIFMSKGDVKERLVNRPYVKIAKSDGTEGKAELFEAWRRSPFRREYNSVEFAPGITLPANKFNTWLGWKIKPPPEGASCDKFVEFILRIICHNDEGNFGWLMDWLAHMVQKPEERSEVAVVLKGGEGIGKGFLLKRLGELVGREHYAHISNSKNAFGDFNAALADLLLLFCDEMFANGDKAQEAEMKRIITEDTIDIVRKGIDPVKEPRYFRTMIASNEFHVVNASSEARRFYILYVNESMRGNWDYWKALAAEWDNSGKEAFFKLLQDRDITAFNHKNAPRTKALADEKLNSLTGAKKYVYNMLCNGEAPIQLFRDGVADYTFGFTRVEAFVETTALAKEAKATSTAMGRALAAIAVGGACGRSAPVGGQQRRGAWLLPLQDARGAFAAWLGVPVDWPDVDGGWVSSLSIGPELQAVSRVNPTV